MNRRCLLSLIGVGMVRPRKASAARSSNARLLIAPLELGGRWGESAMADVAVVIERMRTAAFAGIKLLSDRQPQRLRVEDRSGSFPSIWLHADAPSTAWITVIVGTRDWCNLSYQFGHELGHVLCNSWELNSEPRNPCQWIEEALVEAFSLRGLALLADDWANAPPFPNDNGYASAIRDYGKTILARYEADARNQGIEAGFGNWFKAHEAYLGKHGGVDAARGAVSTMWGLLTGDSTMIEDMGALNRWPGRTGVPLQDYLDLWEKSCAELGASGQLPLRIRKLLAIQ
jgi:hypothetical protein